jgi:hypothetical protein
MGGYGHKRSTSARYAVESIAVRIDHLGHLVTERNFVDLLVEAAYYSIECSCSARVSAGCI